MTIYLKISFNTILKSTNPAAYDASIHDTSNDTDPHYLRGGDGELEQLGDTVNGVVINAGHFDTWDAALDAARAYIGIPTIYMVKTRDAFGKITTLYQAAAGSRGPSK